MGSSLLWVFLGIAILAGIAYLLLNNFYDLEPWFKKVFGAVIGIGILGALVSGFMGMNKDGEMTGKSISEPVVVVQKEEEPKINPNTDPHLLRARKVEKDLDLVINQNISKKRGLYKDSLNMRKKKRWDTFRYDSLLLKVETVEKLVASRKDFLQDDIIAYLEGNMEVRRFNKSIDRYATDVDSLLSYYKIRPK